ncbi:PKD domain-containing protein [Polaribacter porphyrae]|uniref:PKD domain-containing protein n=1 Tax=Polaribacter porphyrae TaxID=1137780 RepID=A0A2S7WR13_9FLAO|nr:PKD domain-containing protein [Polaribacter porphyrae]PQJ79721.1 hypothetical protein BTO18_11295 [Polaribacter porphyrae]
MKIAFFYLLLPLTVFSQTDANVNFTASLGNADKQLFFYPNQYAKDNYTTFLWTFGDGTTSTAINPIHTYANAGTYTVSLKVNNNTPLVKTNVFTVTETGLKIKYVNDIMWPNGSAQDIHAPFTHRKKNSGVVNDFHRALDIKGELGDNIYAIADGYVVDVYTAASGAKIITMKHEMDTPMFFHGTVVSTYYSRFLHLDQQLVTVNPNLLIQKGHLIGKLGSSGTGTYYHNHFEINVGAQHRIGSSLTITADQPNANSVFFTNLIDPSVNPYLFLNNTSNDNNSLRYSLNVQNDRLIVTIKSNLLEDDFNEIAIKYNSGTTNEKELKFNLNTREGLPNSGSGTSRFDFFGEKSNTDYNTNGYNSNAEDVEIFAQNYGRDENGDIINTSGLYRIKDYYIRLEFKNYQSFNTAVGDYIVVRDIFGNKGKKEQNKLVINEINYQSATTSNFDYNKDGDEDFKDDFIEIVNYSNETINLNNYKIYDQVRFDFGMPRYTFPNINLASGKALLIFTYISTQEIANYKNNNPNLEILSVKNNASDASTLSIFDEEIKETMYLTDNNKNLIDYVSTNNFGNIGQADDTFSLVREPELTGGFVRKDDAATPGIFDDTRLSTINFKNKYKLSLYPNPAKNTLFISDDTSKSYIIYNFLGKKIKSGFIENNKVDVSKLQENIYLIRILKEDNTYFTQKIIKE